VDGGRMTSSKVRRGTIDSTVLRAGRSPKSRDS